MYAHHHASTHLIITVCPGVYKGAILLIITVCPGMYKGAMYKGAYSGDRQLSSNASRGALELNSLLPQLRAPACTRTPWDAFSNQLLVQHHVSTHICVFKPAAGAASCEHTHMCSPRCVRARTLARTFTRTSCVHTNTRAKQYACTHRCTACTMACTRTHKRTHTHTHVPQADAHYKLVDQLEAQHGPLQALQWHAHTHKLTHAHTQTCRRTTRTTSSWTSWRRSC